MINLDALVRIKLTTFRDKDRAHLRDLIDVGLMDASWVGHLQPELGSRPRGLLETPDGERERGEGGRLYAVFCTQ